jgi:DNA polymerase-3 subunit chi
MTKIDFYLLADDGKDKPGFACRLTQKAFKQGCQIYIYSDDQALVNRMDNLLWTFQQGSFLPHRVNVDESQDCHDKKESSKEKGGGQT